MKNRVMWRAVTIPLLLWLSPICSSSTSAANISFSDAESPNMDSIAARIAEKLVKTGNKVVAVSHFHAEKSTDSRGYGAKLSEQLSAALTRANAGIQVIDNERLIRALEEKKWIRTAGQTIEISLTLTNTADDKKIAEFKAKLPALPPSESSPDTPVRDPVTQVYLAMAGGVTSPQCKYCPQPEFSPEARSKKITKAKSMLRLTVRADGRATDIRLVRAAGYGLDENAAHAVETWQFVPGRLPDGTAVPTRVDIEVTFEIR